MWSPLDEVERDARAVLEPPPSMSLAEWIEKSIVLPQGVSSRSGSVRLWPYQRGIADAISDPSIERVTIVKSARLGFTTLLSGTIGAYVANEPAPIIVLLPTESDARDYVVSDLEPIFEASPTLRGKLIDDVGDLQRNTLMSRRFPGGSLKVLSAKSPRNLRRHNAQVLLIDEADAMEAGPEGSAIVIAEKRTLGFDDRKIVVGSTPVLLETSNVLRSYATSDRRRFEVPCPDCGAFTFIEWGCIEWLPDQPETAAFRCPQCQELIAERHKPSMVRAGQWMVQNPDVRGHAGFLVNALVSPLPNASWAKLAAEFLTAKDDPDLLQPFVNTVLAQGWSDVEHNVDDTALAARVEPFGLERIPVEVLAITIGCDVQDDRLEASVVGWSGSEQFVLEHRVIWGTPDEDATWAELDELIRTRWDHPRGGKIGVDATAIDSGDGEWTERVYRFCFPRLRHRVLAIKGATGARPALQASKSKVRGGRLFIVGVDGLKTALANRLERGRSIRFSDSLEPVYFEQLTSERKVLRYSRGQPVRRFERKPGARAETWDCLVYANAARQSFVPNWDTRAAMVATPSDRGVTPASAVAQQQRTPAPARRGVVRSSFMS